MTAHPETQTIPVGEGWAGTRINATSFRTDSVATHGEYQYVSYYSPDATVVLAKRKHGEKNWETHDTGLTGNATNPHNVITHGVDGDGYLHVTWGHHAIPLRYVRSIRPGSLEMTEPIPMTGEREQRVTYPEFHPLPDGTLIFTYRDGGSGSGNFMVNHYDPATGEWNPLLHPLISDEGSFNAYTNSLTIDGEGRWHLSWTWRETGNVATNHDICYAMSPDQGKTWLNSQGEPYELPITRDRSEVVVPIPQNSGLINQCSMAVDSGGRPLIATYWNDGDGVPQYRLVWFDGNEWHVSRITERETPFTLGGRGSRRTPLSRPAVAVDDDDTVYYFFCDKERDQRMSVAISRDSNRNDWAVRDLSNEPVGFWEPGFDRVLWQRDRVFHIFKQSLDQRPRAEAGDAPPTTVSILEWQPE